MKNSGGKNNKPMLLNVEVINKSLVFEFNSPSLFVWLENSNKHIPEVYELVSLNNGSYSLELRKLIRYTSDNALYLIVSDNANRLDYMLGKGVLDNVLRYAVLDASLQNDRLCFGINNSLILELYSNTVNLKAQKCNEILPNEIDRPVNICVIGSCFTRSVFNSNSFFNPTYKFFFNVSLTFFHNSFVSLMSRQYCEDDYKSISDLNEKNVFRFVEVEFLKNFKSQLMRARVDYLVIDNYSDAVHPVFEINSKCYLTYNRYIAESIYKRRVAGLTPYMPGSYLHLELYKKFIHRFSLLLDELRLKSKVILVGCRLSKFKSENELWGEKLDWVNTVNRNLDVYDRLFLDEIPSAIYLDMRRTKWISDPATPILGGASPSHYQSGFYQEVFEKLKAFIYKE